MQRSDRVYDAVSSSNRASRLVRGHTGSHGLTLHGSQSPVQICVMYGSATPGVQSAHALKEPQTAGLMLFGSPKRSPKHTQIIRGGLRHCLPGAHILQASADAHCIWHRRFPPQISHSERQLSPADSSVMSHLCSIPQL